MGNELVGLLDKVFCFDFLEKFWDFLVIGVLKMVYLSFYGSCEASQVISSRFLISLFL